MKLVSGKGIEAGRVCTPPHQGVTGTGMPARMAEKGMADSGMTERETGTVAGMTIETATALTQHQEEGAVLHSPLPSRELQCEQLCWPIIMSFHPHHYTPVSILLALRHLLVYVLTLRRHIFTMHSTRTRNEERAMVVVAGIETEIETGTGTGIGAEAQAEGSGRRRPGGTRHQRTSGRPRLCGQAAPGRAAACGARTQAPLWITWHPLPRSEQAALEVCLHFQPENIHASPRS